MRVSEKTGKSVEEAIQLALAELEIDREEAEIEVIESGAKGLFGLIGSKLAKVRVTAKEIEKVENTIVSDKKESKIKEVVKFLQEIFAKMQLKTSINVDYKDSQYFLNIQGDDVGILIGKRGQTLDSLQYLANLMANKDKKEEKFKIILDTEGYRERREQTLKDLAFKLADKVRREGKVIELEPMNPRERKIIHATLQNHKFVYTYSEGEEPYRKVIISRKK